jgi:hypothetical protein
LPTREANIQRAALEARVRANLPAAPPGDPEVVGFLEMIVIAAVLSWFIQRLLSWWWPARARLLGIDRVISRGCARAASRPEARGLTATEVHARVGDRVRAAFTKTDRELSDHDVETFRKAMDNQ